MRMIEFELLKAFRVIEEKLLNENFVNQSWVF